MYLAVSIILVILSLILLFQATRNIFSVTFITGGFLVLTFIGCCIIVGSPWYPLPFYFALSIFFLALGVFLANRVKKFSPKKELLEMRKRKISSLFRVSSPFSFALFSLILLNVLLVGYLFLKSGIPLFATSAEIAKVDIVFDGGNWMLVRCLRIFLPILLLILFLYVLAVKKWLAKIGFILLLFLMVVIYLFYGYKGYFLSYIVIPILFLWAIVRKIRFKEIILLTVLALFVAVPLVGKMLNTVNIAEISSFAFHRYTTLSAEGVDYIVNDLVKDRGVFKGETFVMDMKGLLHKAGVSQGEVLNFNAFLVKDKTGSNPQGRVQIASTLFGEFYANFGLIGSLLGVFIAGFFLQLLYLKSVRSSKDILFLPLFIFFQIAFLSAINTGHTLITLIDMGICAVFILFLLLVFYIFFKLPSGRIVFKKICRKEI